MNARVTPLLRSARAAFKLENLQVTGSFKFRGALEFVSRSKDRGFCAASAGNHGAGLAYAARGRGVPVSVFVPSHTAKNKIERMKSLGVTVTVFGDTYDQCQAHAIEFAKRENLRFVSPYDDELIISGNGDGLAREILAQAPDLKRVVAPVGGGGLLAGLARTLAPLGIEVYGVQPEANCAMKASLDRGAALTVYEGGPTAAAPLEGAISVRTYDYVRAHARGVILVSESDMLRAVARFYREHGQIVEVAGAAAASAWWSEKIDLAPTGATVFVVTGGNIDDSELDEILRQEDSWEASQKKSIS